ncbi:MAG: mechanosensitive ion channel domain-containing protein [Microcoleaceae cyanobacterium]
MSTPLTHFSLYHKWIKQLLIVFCTVLLCFSIPTLVKAQTPETQELNPKVPVVLDGRELYKVGDTKNFTAKERAEEISKLLQEKLDQNLLNGKPVNVAIQQLNQQIILTVNDRYLVSITEADLLPGMMAQEQAEIWQNKVKLALEKSLRERSLSYRMWAFKMIAVAFSVTAIIQGFLFWLSRQHRRRQRINKNQGSLQLLGLLLLKTIVWLCFIYYSLSLFPILRRGLYQVTYLIENTFTTPMFKLGEVPISLNRILLIVIATIALWLLSSLLTQFLKQRILPLAGVDQSLQDAIAFFTQYSLLSLGFLLIINAGGVDFQSIAILLSVIGVGIGFGLQNIAKDFISGLILIVARPIKVGELVQVGDFQGLVQRIGARTTEISHIDRYIITLPNSKFIEAEVLNWNRSGLTRVKAYVGVSYDCDLDLVYKVLQAASQVEHPDILRHPPPKVKFRGYGESELRFRVVAFIQDPLKEPKVRTHLYDQMGKYLKKYDIEIPYPQRDLHIKTPEISPVVQTWLQANRSENYSQNLLLENQTPSVEELTIREEYDWDKIVTAMRGENGVSIEDRWFQLKVFPNVFIGSDAVDWLMKYEKSTREEAIIMGQLMLQQGIIHHVLDEHDFEDEPLFYRFYADEDSTDSMQQVRQQNRYADDVGIDSEDYPIIPPENESDSV